VRFYYDNQPYRETACKGLCTRKEEKVKDGQWVASAYGYDEHAQLVSIQDPNAVNGGYTTEEYTDHTYDPFIRSILLIPGQSPGEIYGMRCLSPLWIPQ
jgi:hypothetical protein